MTDPEIPPDPRLAPLAAFVIVAVGVLVIPAVYCLVLLLLR